MVTDATLEDIPAVIAYIEQTYRRTHYAKSGLVNIDLGEAESFLATAIANHGDRSWIQVARHENGVCGLIVGAVARVYVIGDKMLATDLFWVANRPGDGRKLMRNMIAWACQRPDVVEVVGGTSGLIAGSPARAGRILERLGMSQYGSRYRLEV